MQAMVRIMTDLVRVAVRAQAVVDEIDVGCAKEDIDFTPLREALDRLKG